MQQRNIYAYSMGRWEKSFADVRIEHVSPKKMHNIQLHSTTYTNTHQYELMIEVIYKG